MIQEHTIVLQRVSCQGMGSLLAGPSWDLPLSDTTTPTNQWITSLLLNNSDKLRRIGRAALVSFFQGNINSPDFVSTALRQCYSATAPVAKGYFLALVEYSKETALQCPLPVLLNLVCFKAGDKVLGIRKQAIYLLQLITAHDDEKSDGDSDDSDDESLVYEWPAALDSAQPDTIFRAQRHLSAQLASDFSHLAFAFLEDVVERLDGLSSQSQKQMFNYLLPWVEKIVLTDSEYAKAIPTILEKLLLITLKFTEAHPISVERLWKTIAEKEDNVGPLVQFLLETGVKKVPLNICV